MKFTRTLLVAALCLAVAHSVPVPNEESFKSQASTSGPEKNDYN